MTPQELNERFGLPGVVDFDAGEGGLTRVRIAAAGGRAEIYLLGAHVTDWPPAGRQPVPWVSRESPFAVGQAIRGGVPVCWPWFAAKGDEPDAPLHGFARLVAWQVESADRLDDGGAAVTLALRSDERTKQYWRGDFELRHRVAVGSTLTMTLGTHNLGTEPMTVTEALHSYLRVSDVRNVSVSGLAGVEYFDKVTGGPNRTQGDEPITFAGETDRVYLDTAAAAVLDDPGLGRTITIEKTGSRSTVVWNPWVEKAARMDSFGDDEWPQMVCIETANALTDAVTIPPGETHCLEARIHVS
jgi:glucose-6-phosphate 1-epimerase